MIINTGGRCDIVNYFSDWLIKRFEEGFVYSRNPYVPNTVHKYVLSPDVVDCVLFCSKNYAPMLDKIDKIASKFNVFCHYTITAYGADIEPNVPSIKRSIETLIALSKIVGPKRLAWRYDPVLLTELYTVEHHIETFNNMATKITPYVGLCIFSFVDMYKKLERNMPEIIPLRQTDMERLAEAFGAIGKKYGLKLQTCAENGDYTKFGIANSGCTSVEILEAANGVKFKTAPKAKVRENCKCIQSRDIGAYDACPNGCKYCYANKNPEIALQNIKNHNPNSPILIGEIKEEDIIKDGAQKSFLRKGSMQNSVQGCVQGFSLQNELSSPDVSIQGRLF